VSTVDGELKMNVAVISLCRQFRTAISLYRFMAL